MNITTQRNGFEFNNIDYTFNEETKTAIVSSSQLFAFTDCGTVLLDLSCSINEFFYDDISTFQSKLSE